MQNTSPQFISVWTKECRAFTKTTGIELDIGSEYAWKFVKSLPQHPINNFLIRGFIEKIKSEQVDEDLSPPNVKVDEIPGESHAEYWKRFYELNKLFTKDHAVQWINAKVGSWETAVGQPIDSDSYQELTRLIESVGTTFYSRYVFTASVMFTLYEKGQKIIRFKEDATAEFILNNPVSPCAG